MSETPQKQSRLAQALLVVGGLLALMWALEGLDTVTALPGQSCPVRPPPPPSTTPSSPYGRW